MKADFSTLTHENCALYLNMTKYLSEKHLNKSDYDRVCEDLFLMISDAQTRGESVENLFPNGIQKFCDEVAANCAKEKWYITLLNILFYTFAVLSAVMFIEVLAIKFWANEGEWIAGATVRIELSGLIGALLAAVAGMVFGILSSKFVFKKFIFDKKPGFYFYVLLDVAVAVAIAIILDLTVTGIFITLNWVALAVGAFGAATLIFFIKFFIARFTSKKL